MKHEKGHAGSSLLHSTLILLFFVFHFSFIVRAGGEWTAAGSRSVALGGASVVICDPWSSAGNGGD